MNSYKNFLAKNYSRIIDIIKRQEDEKEENKTMEKNVSDFEKALKSNDLIELQRLKPIINEEIGFFERIKMIANAKAKA